MTFEWFVVEMSGGTVTGGRDGSSVPMEGTIESESTRRRP
jgi:hypothetical protein